MPYELIAGAVSGLAGFIFKAHANAIDGLKQVAELQVQQQMTADQLANSAAKRSTPWARKILAFMVIGTFVCGLLYAAAKGINVSLVHESEPKSILWGLFEWGSGMKVTVAEGFVMPAWTGYAVSIVLGFFLGTGSAKPSK